MSISYSAIVGFGSGKVTLPSVDTWGTNMNILRNPPSSITTRRIDKVGETSEITQAIQESGDRACETIKVYARGTNPMVGVSYGNNGTSGGQRSTGRTNISNHTSSFLPYRVMRDGAFRPPIRDQRDNIALSRLPRVWTSSFTQPGFADFSKKALCMKDQNKDGTTDGVKETKTRLKGCIRPTVTYKLETPIIEPFEARYNIKESKIKVEKNTHKESNMKKQVEIGTVHLGIDENKVKPQFEINKGVSSIRKEGENLKNIKPYVTDVLKGEMNSNLNRNIYKNVNGEKNIEQYVKDYSLIDVNSNIKKMGGNQKMENSIDTKSYIQKINNKNIETNKKVNFSNFSYDPRYNNSNKIESYIKENPNIEYTPLKTGYTKMEYIHDDLVLENKLRGENIVSNISRRIDVRNNDSNDMRRTMKNVNIVSVDNRRDYGYNSNRIENIDSVSSRNYNLRPTINAGSFHENVGKPLAYHENDNVNVDSQKSEMRSRIYDMQQQRNEMIGSIPYTIE
jgi:hypothetical protein